MLRVDGRAIRIRPLRLGRSASSIASELARSRGTDPAGRVSAGRLNVVQSLRRDHTTKSAVLVARLLILPVARSALSREHAVAADGGECNHEPPRLNRNVTPNTGRRVSADKSCLTAQWLSILCGADRNTLADYSGAIGRASSGDLLRDFCVNAASGTSRCSSGACSAERRKQHPYANAMLFWQCGKGRHQDLRG